MAELLAYAPEIARMENPRLSDWNADEYAKKALETKNAATANRLSELNDRSADLSSLAGEFLSPEDIKALLDGSEKERRVLLASLDSGQSFEITPEVAEAIREIGKEIWETVKDAIIPEWYEIPIYAMPIAGEAAGANRMRKIAEACAKVAKTLEKLKAAGGIRKEGAEVIEKALKDLMEKGETGRLSAVIDALRKGDAPRKQLAEELARTKELAESTKKAKMAETPSVPKPEAKAAKDTVETAETLKGFGHKGRVERLSELYSRGNPDKEKFAGAAKERLEEAEKYLDHAVKQKWITPEARTTASEEFLKELRKAAESHVGDGKVPDLRTAQEALRYLETIKSPK